MIAADHFAWSPISSAAGTGRATTTPVEAKGSGTVISRPASVPARAIHSAESVTHASGSAAVPTVPETVKDSTGSMVKAAHGPLASLLRVSARAARTGATAGAAAMVTAVASVQDTGAAAVAGTDVGGAAGVSSRQPTKPTATRATTVTAAMRAWRRRAARIRARWATSA